MLDFLKKNEQFVIVTMSFSKNQTKIENQAIFIH